MTDREGIPVLMTVACDRSNWQPMVALPTAAPNDFLALTNGVAAGDEAASREFFQRYCDRLFRYALVLTRGDEDLSREILSVTMIKAVRTMRPMPSDGDVWRWMTRLATTSFIDHCRKSKRRIPLTHDEFAAHSVAAPNPDMTLSTALVECLGELPDEEREIVERYYFDDASQADLAVRSGSTRKAVESRLARIRGKLRAAILKKLS